MPTFIGRELGRRWCPSLLGWGLHTVRHDKGSQRLPQAGCLHVVLRLSRMHILETQEPGYIMYFLIVLASFYPTSGRHFLYF